MSLLGPALLAGLIGLGLPVIAHLLGRQPPRRIRFAAVRFLVETRDAVTHRRSIHNWPLLLLRMLILALLVLILARPATVNPASLAVVAKPHDAIFLLDASRSMGLRIDDDPLLSHGARRIESLLDALPAGSTAGLTTSNPEGVRLEAGADPSRVRSAVKVLEEQGQPSPGSWVLRDAVPVAARLLPKARTGTDRKRVIYAVGDATERGLGSLPDTAEGGVLVIPIPALDDPEIPAHLSIDEVGWEPAPDLDPQAVRVHATVHHHAGTTEPDEQAAERSVELALLVGEAEVARTSVTVEPDDTVGVEFTHTLLEAKGPVPATVALVGDGGDPLPSDDRRHLWLSVADALEIVVVNGDPSQLRAHDEIYFLTTALASSKARHDTAVRSLAPDQLAARIREHGTGALADVDLLILANVGAPAQDVSPAIIESVRRGMGLWITTGDRVQSQAYNDRFGELLPLLLRQAVKVGTAPGRKEARVEGIAPVDLGHDAFRGMTSDLGLSGTRAQKIFLLEPDPSRAGEIAIAFTSGAPALITREVGSGRVALLATSIDRDWSDLPLRPGFVPLVHRTIVWLGGGRGELQGSTLRVGESKRFRSEQPVTIHTPAGGRQTVAPGDDGVAAFRKTHQTGHYRAKFTGERERTDVFAVQVDPAESEIEWLTEATERDDDEQTVRRVVTWQPQWRALVPMLALFLLVETGLRWWARQGPAGRARR